MEEVSSQGIIYTLGSDGKGWSVSGFDEQHLEKDVIIPSTYQGRPVTSIGDSAFFPCDKFRASRKHLVAYTEKSLGHNNIF